jgi:predicted nucleotidyltransferase
MPRRSSSSVRVFYPPFNREQLLVLLRRRINELQRALPLRRVVLFGSYAKAKHTVASDIDLLVVYGGEPQDDAYALVKRILNIRRLEPHVYTEEEYAQMATTWERMLEDSIPLEWERQPRTLT